MTSGYELMGLSVEAFERLNAAQDRELRIYKLCMEVLEFTTDMDGENALALDILEILKRPEEQCEACR